MGRGADGYQQSIDPDALSVYEKRLWKLYLIAHRRLHVHRVLPQQHWLRLIRSQEQHPQYREAWQILDQVPPFHVSRDIK